MRQIRISLALLFVLGLLLAACGGTAAPQAPAEQPTAAAAPAQQPTAAPAAEQPTAAPQAPTEQPTAAPAEQPTAAPAPEQPTAAAPAEPAAPAADSGLPVDVPRDQVLVVDQIFRYSVVDNFNFFVPGPASPTQQGLLYDTLR